MHEKADSQLIKTLNEKRILNLIREKGPISRNELSKVSKISKVAVSEIVSRIDEAGYIIEIGKGKSTSRGGKRPTLIKLNPDSGYVIAMEIKRSYATIALANIESDIKDRTLLNYQPGISIDDALSKIIRQIDLLLEKNQISKEKLVSIGIGIPGFINYNKGELQFADTLQGWANLPLSARFSQYYGVPTILENDVNTIALGEKLLGAGLGRRNIVCVWIGEGIGAGIIMGGQLIRGATGNAGEIGYLELGHHVWNYEQLKSLYQGQKYFGEILSEVNLYDRLRFKLQRKIDDNLNHEILKQIILEGDRGDETIKSILKEYAYLLSLLCVFIIKTINPSLIILNGLVIENSHYTLEQIREFVKQGMINIPFKPSTIVLGELKSEAGVKGAIALALQTIFEPPVTRSGNHLKFQK